MKIKSFFKFLKRKIYKYDKIISNPFEVTPTQLTLIWIEDDKTNFKKFS